MAYPVSEPIIKPREATTKTGKNLSFKGFLDSNRVDAK